MEQTPDGQPTGTTVYAALEKKEHHRTVSDLEQKPEPSAPRPGASTSEVMKHRLKSAAGRAKYKLRQQTVEPVFGIIKSVLGFRQFLLRGLTKVALERNRPAKPSYGEGAGMAGWLGETTIIAIPHHPTPPHSQRES